MTRGSFGTRRADRRRGPLLASIALLLATLGCGGERKETALAGPRPAAILLVTASGMRADSFEISSLPDAVSFERALAPSSLDVQSLASIFSGRLPTRGGIVGLLEAQPAPQATTLATRLRRAGFATALVAGEPWARREGFTRGFDQVEIADEEGWSSTEVTARAAAAWGSLVASQSPLLLAVHYSGPLSRGVVGERGAGLLEPGDLVEELAGVDSDELAAHYRRDAAALSSEIDALIARLGEAGGLDDTLVVIAGLSGFELGEHGGVANGWTTHYEVVRVPLLLRWRGRIDPAASAAASLGPVSLVELLPSLVAVAAAEAPADGELDGASFLHAARDGWDLRPEAGPRIAELVVRERAISRSVLDGQLFYTFSQRVVPPGDRAVVARGIEEIQAAMLAGSHETPPLWGPAVVESLTDLTSGEGEQASLLDEPPIALSRIRATLRDYRRLCDETAWEPLEITRRLEIDPEQLRQLESLGYL